MENQFFLSLIQLLAINFFIHLHLLVFSRPAFSTGRFSLRPLFLLLSFIPLDFFTQFTQFCLCSPLNPSHFVLTHYPDDEDSDPLRPPLFEKILLVFALQHRRNVVCLTPSTFRPCPHVRLRAVATVSLLATINGDRLCKKLFHPNLSCHPTLLLLRLPSCLSNGHRLPLTGRNINGTAAAKTTTQDGTVSSSTATPICDPARGVLPPLSTDPFYLVARTSVKVFATVTTLRRLNITCFPGSRVAVTISSVICWATRHKSNRSWTGSRVGSSWFL